MYYCGFNTYDLQTWLWYHYNISQRHTTTNTDKIIYQFICYSIFGFICIFCRPLFVLLFIFFWPLCCLFFFSIRILITPLVSSNSSYNHNRGRRGHDRMVVGFTTIYSIGAYHHTRCEFESWSGEVYSVQHYVIKFVSDLRQVGLLWVLRFPPPIKLTVTI